MKIMLLTLVVGLSLASACTNTALTEKEIIALPEEHNMRIIPHDPGSNDKIKLVVYDDCNYNVLTGITRNGNIIAVEKQFNGMMKRPCIIQNDTIMIGNLSAGSYKIHYKLMNIAYTPAIPALSLTFPLYVSR